MLYWISKFSKLFDLVQVNVILLSDHFLEVIKRANLEPTKKYKEPQTESQEIGWITKPLVSMFLVF